MASSTLSSMGYPTTLIMEYEYWALLLRPDQVTFGSMVIVIKEEIVQLSDISHESFIELKLVIDEVEKLRRFLNYDKINYLSLMMVDPEVHFHVIPRYNRVITFNDIKFFDPGWPGLPLLTNVNEVSKSTFDKLLEELKSRISL